MTNPITTRSRNLSLDLFKYADVRTPELVNTLLGITDDEQAAAIVDIG